MEPSDIDFSSVLDKLGSNVMLLLNILMILAGAFIMERALLMLIQRAHKRGEQGREDDTRYRFHKNALRFLVGTVAVGLVIYVIPSLKHFAVTLLAGAGILVAILDLATHPAFSNIISGIFIVSFKPFREVDKARVMHFELNRSIKLRFDREGIELPYPHRTLTFKGPGVARDAQTISTERPPAATHEEGV